MYGKEIKDTLQKYNVLEQSSREEGINATISSNSEGIKQLILP